MARNSSLKELLPASWESVVGEEFSKPYMNELEEFLRQEFAQKLVFPPRESIFEAFARTSYDDVRVLLLGQDPYHGEGQAHGLSFSVPPGMKIPPSLRNMFKELHTDLGVDIPVHGNLTAWAQQGVLLLNSVLTVRAHQAASHKKKGWEKFTDAVITAMNKREKPLVFLLWGGFAKKKKKLITHSRHVIIEGTHPSPLSAYGGFWGSKPYSAVNDALKSIGSKGINWEL